MKLEQYQQAFSSPPESFHRRVKETVSQQLDTSKNIVTSARHSRSRRYAYRIAAAIIAAVILIPTVVYAGYRLFFSTELDPVGSYGAKVSIAQGSTAEENVAEIPATLPAVTYELSEIPDGFSWTNETHLMKNNDAYRSGFCFANVIMDQESLDTSRIEYFVTDQEKLTFDDRESIYLNHQTLRTPSFSQYIYVPYPELQRVLIIYATNDIAKEDFIQVARNTALVATGEEILSSNITTWQEYTNMQNGYGARAGQEHRDDSEPSTDLNNNITAHNIGETIPYYSNYPGVEVTLSSVQIESDLNLLDPAYFNLHSHYDRISPLIDENNALLPATVDFIWYGDGINSLDTTVDSATVAMKLVYTTVQFTNTSEEGIEHLLFSPVLLTLRGKGGKTEAFPELQSPNTDYRTSEEQEYFSWNTYNHQDLTEVPYDTTITSPEDLHRWDSMLYYDVYDDSTDGANHIPYLGPGETQTIHIAWVVTEDELPYMYLCFGERYSMNKAYDIRQ